MIYNIAYPIYHTFTADDLEKIDYQILKDNESVYNGVIYPMKTGPIKIDISPIIREYIKVNYEDIIDSKSNVNYNVSDVVEFTVDGVKYKVIYDYNLDYINIKDDRGCLNNYIDGVINQYQNLYISNYNLNDTYIIKMFINNKEVLNKDLNGGDYIKCYKINMSEFVLKPKDKVRIMVINDDEVKEFNFIVINDCGEQFVVHYVNTVGGLDSLLCYGKNVKNIITEEIKIEHREGLSSKTQFNTSIIEKKLTKAYELNTGLLNDVQSERIIELLSASQIWIEDIRRDRIISADLKDNRMKVKKYKNNKIVNYTLNFEENKKYLIR